MYKSDIRAAEYRSRAHEALALGEASILLQVRRRHEAAALVWQDLAAFEDRRSAHARDTAARLLVEPGAPPSGQILLNDDARPFGTA